MKYLTPEFNIDLISLPHAPSFCIKALYNHRVALKHLHSFGDINAGDIDARAFHFTSPEVAGVLFYGIFDSRFVRFVLRNTTTFSRYYFCRVVCKCVIYKNDCYSEISMGYAKVYFILPTANILLCDIL